MTFEEYFDYDWNALSQKVYENNHQWWHDLQTGEKLVRNPKLLLALMTSEISEALEGFRKNLKDDHLPHRDMAEVEIADHLIRTLDFVAGMEIELESPDYYRYKGSTDIMRYTLLEYFDDDKSSALYDLNGAMMQCYGNGINQTEQLWFAYIMTICAYAIKFNLDIMGALTEKMEYNKHREDHKKEARLAQGGKAF